MKRAEFIHLHNHSEYSLLDGMLRVCDDKGKPSEFIKHLSAKNIPALALTDHGNMYGAADFYFAARAAGIIPIIGCEVYTAAGSRKEKSGRGENGHLTLLAKDFEGYQNLMALVSDAFTEGFYHDPRIDFESLSQYSKGLIGLSGCLKSHISQACLVKDIDKAGELAKKYEDILGKGNFYIELMDHGIPEEKQAMGGLLEVAKRTGLPVVATNDCHYERKEDWKAQDINICIRTGRTLDDPGRMKMATHELYFKSADEMKALFSHTPDAIKNTIHIAEQCFVEIPTDKFILPHFELPKSEGGAAQAQYLEKLCLEGLAQKIGGDIPPAYRERLKFELETINRMNFPSYFLIVSDFINYARSKNIPVGPGRGSGAGSLVAYSLDITRVDPIVNGLLFERFLNPGRLTMPDLDIDFSDAGRQEVIDYVRNKYGAKNVAQIVTFGTIKAKLAIKDTARVMGFTPSEANKFSKLIPNALDATISGAIQSVKEISDEMRDKRVKELFENAMKIEGLKRHTGVHAAGTVITREEVVKYTPLARGSRDVITSQYEGETLVRLGLLKIDFLGLRTLTVIDTALKLIKELRGIDLDIQKIPLDDKKTYELLCSAKTACVFQLESRGMRDLVRELKPSHFSDISALVALYRPGPMQSGMLKLFVNRKHGREKVVYDHPLMEGILKETYGTMVYQEQVMEIAKSLAGFSPAQADELRKAMGKKLADAMEKAREDFVKGCAKNNIKEGLAVKIFNQMAQFAGYGFNKSHSVAYALLAYQTAYLKANYPSELMTSALISEIGHNAIGSEDRENKIVTYLDEAKSMGIETLPPDISKSAPDFSIEKSGGKDAIRYGLRAVKNVGDEAAAALHKAAKEKPFTSIDDICRRVDARSMTKKTLESLAKAGALDSVYSVLSPLQARAKILAEIEGAVSLASKIKQEEADKTDCLFGGALEITLAPVSAASASAETAVMTEHELLANEKEVLGFYLSGHPLAEFDEHIKMIAPLSIAEAVKLENGAAVRLAGLVSSAQRKISKRKEQWAKFELEDLSGNIIVNVFPKNFEKFGHLIKTQSKVLVTGRLNNEDENASEFSADDIIELDMALSSYTKNAIIKISADFGDEKLSALRDILTARKGDTPIFFEIAGEGKNPSIFDAGIFVYLSFALIKEIETLTGKNTVVIENNFKNTPLPSRRYQP